MSIGSNQMGHKVPIIVIRYRILNLFGTFQKSNYCTPLTDPEFIWNIPNINRYLKFPNNFWNVPNLDMIRYFFYLNLRRESLIPLLPSSGVQSLWRNNVADKSPFIPHQKEDARGTSFAIQIPEGKLRRERLRSTGTLLHSFALLYLNTTFWQAEH
jgi:hypothetical protein